MNFVDLHRKAWALRSLREAKVSLIQARDRADIASISLLMSALRKSQAAIYYSLGDPEFIEPIVRNFVEKRKKGDDPLLQFLVEIELTISDLSGSMMPQRDAFIERAASTISAAEEIIRTVFGKAA